MSRRARRRHAAAAAALWLLGAGGSLAQPESAEGFMLLENKFGELCTMCEATVICRRDDAVGLAVADLARPETAPYTLYHFQTKTFWGQVGTIWDYLVRWIEPVTTERRPVRVYQVEGFDDDAPRGRLTEAMGVLSLDPARIDVAGHSIDRRSREWFDADGERLGQCARLPLRDTYRFLKAKAPWTPASAGATRG